MNKKLENLGVIKRRHKWFGKHQDTNEDKKFHFVGRIHADTLNGIHHLLSGVKVTIVLQLNELQFYIFGGNTPSSKIDNTVLNKPFNYKVNFDKVYYKVRRIKINPAVDNAIALTLENNTAKYPLKRGIIRNINMTPGAKAHNIVGIYNGPMPTRVIVGFVYNNDFYGDYQSNPFNFINKIRKIELKCASQSVPYKSALVMDWDNRDWMEGYNSLFENIGEGGNNLTYEDYGFGNTLFAFDLTPDLSCGDHESVLRSGSLDLEVDFDKEVIDPGKAINAIFYMEFNQTLEITKNRAIINTFSE